MNDVRIDKIVGLKVTTRGDTDTRRAAVEIADANGALIVSVGYDGNITLGAGHSIDEASVAFYERFADVIRQSAP